MKKSVQWITKPNKHLWVAIVPLLHTNSGTIGVEKRRFLYIMGAKMTLTDFTLHFSCCFTNLLHSHFVPLLNNFTMQEKCY